MIRNPSGGLLFGPSDLTLSTRARLIPSEVQLHHFGGHQYMINQSPLVVFTDGKLALCLKNRTGETGEITVEQAKQLFPNYDLVFAPKEYGPRAPQSGWRTIAPES